MRARRVVVVGGGVTGLTTAYRLAQADASLDVTVLEAADRRAASSAASQVGDLRLPAGADSFVARKPWAVDLCTELGTRRRAGVARRRTGAYLWTDRGLVAFRRTRRSASPATSATCSAGPGCRVPGVAGRAAGPACEASGRTTGDETLGSLLRRRLGDEATDLAVAPLLAGLFAGDVDRLSVQRDVPGAGRVGGDRRGA